MYCVCDVTRVFLHGVTAARGGRHTRGGRATKQGENFTLHASLCGERVGEVHQRRLVAVEAEGGEQLVSLQRRVDVGRVDARLALLLDVAHRALQHLEVEVGPDLLGAEAALLRRAEERAGASQLEVGAREGVPSFTPMRVMGRPKQQDGVAREGTARPAPSPVSLWRTRNRSSVSGRSVAGSGCIISAYACTEARPTRPRSWCSCERPKSCVSCTTIVLTLGMSIPFSMIVVATSTSDSPSVKSTIRRSRSRSPPAAGRREEGRGRDRETWYADASGVSCLQIGCERRVREGSVPRTRLEVAQLAVRVREARLGDEAREEVHLALHVLDARHDVKDLGRGLGLGVGLGVGSGLGLGLGLGLGVGLA